jgi:hypothetical protein
VCVCVCLCKPENLTSEREKLLANYAKCVKETTHILHSIVHGTTYIEQENIKFKMMMMMMMMIIIIIIIIRIFRIHSVPFCEPRWFLLLFGVLYEVINRTPYMETMSDHPSVCPSVSLYVT